jgi:hypothetical protein
MLAMDMHLFCRQMMAPAHRILPTSRSAIGGIVPFGLTPIQPLIVREPSLNRTGALPCGGYGCQSVAGAEGVGRCCGAREILCGRPPTLGHSVLIRHPVARAVIPGKKM